MATAKNTPQLKATTYYLSPRSTHLPRPREDDLVDRPYRDFARVPPAQFVGFVGVAVVHPADAHSVDPHLVKAEAPDSNLKLVKFFIRESGGKKIENRKSRSLSNRLIWEFGEWKIKFKKQTYLGVRRVEN